MRSGQGSLSFKKSRYMCYDRWIQYNRCIQMYNRCIQLYNRCIYIYMYNRCIIDVYRCIQMYNRCIIDVYRCVQMYNRCTIVYKVLQYISDVLSIMIVPYAMQYIDVYSIIQYNTSTVILCILRVHSFSNSHSFVPHSSHEKSSIPHLGVSENDQETSMPSRENWPENDEPVDGWVFSSMSFRPNPLNSSVQIHSLVDDFIWGQTIQYIGDYNGFCIVYTYVIIFILMKRKQKARVAARKLLWCF